MVLLWRWESLLPLLLLLVLRWRWLQGSLGRFVRVHLLLLLLLWVWGVRATPTTCVPASSASPASPIAVLSLPTQHQHATHLAGSGMRSECTAHVLLSPSPSPLSPASACTSTSLAPSALLAC